ncbi:MAG TPA: 5-dehydro-4-deoxy-D-glucuronate isomerase [Saprospiraceae bacterium]|nr:5-dehydro-4-deoxy-D-glucuronate isomerase [Saprospiraceae bacterium]
MSQNYTLRYAAHPEDVKQYDTQRLRKEFLISNLMKKGEINMVYSLYDRFVTGGAVPTTKQLTLKPFEELKAKYFLERRELGIINVGNTGSVTIDGKVYKMKYKEALYVGRGAKKIVFKSNNKAKPALFYFNSAPAHKAYPTKLVTLEDADIVHLGSLKTSNDRQINKLLVNSIVETCQLQMGMTELKEGSVWNTMPAHSHNRRMEVYFYFEVPKGQAVAHFMGQPQETRHIWLQNNEAVISPSWSIHAGAGTSNYIFIWGMAGENLDYGDMDGVKIPDLR